MDHRIKKKKGEGKKSGRRANFFLTLILRDRRREGKERKEEGARGQRAHGRKEEKREGEGGDELRPRHSLFFSTTIA